MKHLSRKLFVSLAVAAMMVFSTGVSFAGSAADTDKTETAETLKLKPQKTSEQTVKNALSGAESLSQNKAVYGIGYVELKTGNEKLDSYVGTVSYGINDTKSGTARGYSEKISVPAKGTVTMSVRAEDDYSAGDGTVYFGVFKDVNLTQPVDSYRSVTSNGSDIKTNAFSVPSKGDYYLGVYSYISSSTKQQNYTVYSLAAYANGTDRTLSNGKWIAVGQKDAQTNYFKFKAVSTGYIKVSDSQRGTITLLNSKKKALSSADYNYYTPVYGVKKGSTYYVKVKSNYSAEGGYQLKVTNSKISEKSGSKKSKAVTLKKGSTKKGVIAAGESKADWYKFKLTGKKTVKMTIKGGTNDRLKIVVYDGSKTIKTSTFWNSTKSISLKSVGKWTKGTYYVKVYRGNKTSSGWYSLCWK